MSYHTQEFFEANTKTVEKTSKSLLQKSKTTNATIQNIVKSFHGASIGLAINPTTFNKASKGVEKQKKNEIDPKIKIMFGNKVIIM